MSPNLLHLSPPGGVDGAFGVHAAGDQQLVLSTEPTTRGPAHSLWSGPFHSRTRGACPCPTIPISWRSMLARESLVERLETKD